MHFKYEGITIGADPELFLKSKATGGYVAACGLVGGTKEKPRKIDKKGHAVQEDNVMVEYNIPPCRTVQKWLQSHNHVMLYLKQTLPLYDLVVEASAEFPADQLVNPQAAVFGCDPDYDAWNMRVNLPPNAKTNIRTCGGHIHVGYKNPDINNQVALVRALDYFVGLPSVVLDPDKVRKSRYGKAGAFRPKEYGAEYRVASNFWLKNPQLIQWAYESTHKAVGFLNEGKTIAKDLGAAIQACINKGDEVLARSLCKEHGLLQGV